MKAKIILLLFTTTVLFSCSEKGIYNKFIEFPENHRWFKSDKKTFNFTIADDTKLYDVVFKFSHVYDYQFDSVPIRIDITNPSGESEFHTIDFNIKDSSGKPLADCSGDVCDMTMKIIEKSKLTKGMYKIEIYHDFKNSYLPNVIGIGLEVDSIKDNK